MRFCGCVAAVTSGETVDDGGGGGVVDDVGAVVEIVQIVATVEAPEPEHVIQDHVLHERGRETG